MLNWDAVKHRANADGEFQIHARFWNSTVKLAHGADGERAEKVSIVDGRIDSIEPWFAASATNLVIQAPDADWDELLAAVPKPFYQDLYPASLHHGFNIVGDTTHMCAYYPAVRRLIEIMREVKNVAG